MKFFALLFLVLPFLLSGQSSQAGSLDCKNRVTPVRAGTALHRAITRSVDRGAALPLPRLGNLGRMFVLQECNSSRQSFQGVAVNFGARYGAPGRKPHFVTCLAKQKRYRNPDGAWTAWINAGVTCRPARVVAPGSSIDLPGGSGDSNESSGNSSAAPSPDELFDPDFYQRSPSFGADDDSDSDTGRNPGTGEDGGTNPGTGDDDWH